MVYLATECFSGARLVRRPRTQKGNPLCQIVSISLLTVLLITTGLLVSCVPVPMEDLAAQQTPVAPAQRAEATPLPTAIANNDHPAGRHSGLGDSGRCSDYRADACSDRVGDRFTEGCINRDCGRSNQRGTHPADGHEQAQ